MKTKIQVWSDFKCPFCYLGKTRLEKVICDNQLDVEVELMSFELDHLHEPDHSTPYYEKMQQKIKRPIDVIKSIHDDLQTKGKELGLDYQFEKSVDANTAMAHRVFQLAKEKGDSKMFVDLAFKAHFTEGLDIGNEEIILSIALKSKLNEKDVLDVLHNRAYQSKVFDEHQIANKLGATGVPYFVIDGKVSVAGAQSEAHFLQAIEYAKTIK